MAKRPISLEQRKSMTFLQAEGYEELPAMMQWGEIDNSIRLGMWDYFYALMHHSKQFSNYGLPYFQEDTKKLLTRIFRYHLKLPLHEAMELASDVHNSIELIKKLVFDVGAHEVLDLVQFTLRDRRCPGNLGAGLRKEIAVPHSPYLIVEDPPTIVPRGSPEEGESVARGLQEIKLSVFSGARTHLLSSAEALNNGDNRGAICEAIHAVESASKKITRKDSATLPDCLKLLKKEHGLHPALETAFNKLYAYTSDEKGIRHALTEGDNEKVGIDEALFMFSACTAFVSYLARKFPEQS
jgi:hypothetical protein